MPDITVDLKGWKELDAKLAAMKDDLAKRAMKKAVRAGALPMLEDIKLRVPIRSGTNVKVKRKNQWTTVLRHVRDDLALRVTWSGLTASAKIYPRSLAYIVNWLERTGARPHGEGAKYKKGQKTETISTPVWETVTGFFGRPEMVRRWKKQTLVIASGVVVAGVQHPGFKPKPFIVPGFDATWRKTVEVIKETLARSIERYTKKG